MTSGSTVFVGSVELSNPVMAASGTAGYGTELAGFFDLSSLGAVVVKSLSAEPWEGNPAPRVWGVPGGMLNAVGLQNPGVSYWAEHYLADLAASGAAVVVSLWGRSVEGYRQVAETLAEVDAQLGRCVVAVEANISCPNVEARNSIFAHTAQGAAEATSAVVAGLRGRWPVWAKLSPNVTDLVAIADSVLEAGAESLTLVNTLMGLALDTSGKPRLGKGGGGLSGPAIHPIAVRAVSDCRGAFPDVGIVGVGGITNLASAQEMLRAGANAIQIGTASFVDPRVTHKIAKKLARVS